MQNIPYGYRKRIHVCVKFLSDCCVCGCQVDPLTDPLGIAGTSLGSPAGSVHSRHPSTDSIGPLPCKRASSEDFNMGKRPSFNYRYISLSVLTAIFQVNLG